MDDQDLEDLYAWIDEIPLSRQKNKIERDFSDGVLVAEVIHHHAPRLVELHNYVPANSVSQKMENWRTLQRKCFKKLGLSVPENVLQGITTMKQGVIEVVLNNIRLKLLQYDDNPIEQAHSQYSQYRQRSAPPPQQLPPPKHSPRSLRQPPSQQQQQSQVRQKSSLTSPGKKNVGSPRKTTTATAASAGSPRGGKIKVPLQPSAHDDPYNVIDQLRAELLDNQETIGILQLKIEKLEQLIQLKDQKIDDLMSARNGYR